LKKKKHSESWPQSLWIVATPGFQLRKETNLQGKAYLYVSNLKALFYNLYFLYKGCNKNWSKAKMGQAGPVLVDQIWSGLASFRN